MNATLVPWQNYDEEMNNIIINVKEKWTCLSDFEYISLEHYTSNENVH